MKTKIVWDHNAIGSPVIFHPSLSGPLTLLLKEQTIGMGCRHMASVGCERGTFVATLGVNKSGEGLVASIDKFDERTSITSASFLLPDDVAVPCTFHQRAVCSESQSSGDYLSWLKCFHYGVSSPSEASLSRSLSLRLHAHLVGPNCKVEVRALSPTNSFRAVPVHPLPILDTALSQSLSGSSGQIPKTGFLSMDQSRKLLVLLENDVRVKSCPLIGIWVSGVSSPADPRVWTACLRFFTCPDYSTRAVRPEEPFLLLVFSRLHSSGVFYDCLCNASKVTYSLLEGQGQMTVTKVPSFSSRVCAVDLQPADNVKHLKPFQDALTKFQAEILPLPYCESAMLAFPSDTCDYPRSIPTPPVQNFFLKPSVPDLSLLSETSRCSAKAAPQPDARRLPLTLRNCNLQSPTDQTTKDVGSTSRVPAMMKQGANCCAEPQPRPAAAASSQKENAAPPDLTVEAQHLLRSKNVNGVYQTPHVRSSASTPVVSTAQYAACNVRNVTGDDNSPRNENLGHVWSPALRDSGNVQQQHLAVAVRNVEPRPEAKTSETSGGDPANKSAIFHNLHQLLKQKDERVQELQEQVRELLDLQRQQAARDEENDSLMQKMDVQNEQLTQLKEQITLLLENQTRTDVSAKTVSPQMERCSVGVMTSILVENHTASGRAATSCIVRGVDQPQSTSSKNGSGEGRNSMSPQPVTWDNPVSSRDGLKNCCSCRCGRADQISFREERVECLNKTVSSKASPQECASGRRQIAAFSVDESLPLGASVSLYEDGFAKAVNGECQTRFNSGKDNRVQMLGDGARRPTRLTRTESEERLSREGHQERNSRELSELLRPRRLSLDDDFEKNAMPLHQRDGSVLLPKLNYQTLCLSDESDGESARASEILSVKYLRRKPRSLIGSNVQSRRIATSPVADACFRNMSFATREYLERYGLVS